MVSHPSTRPLNMRSTPHRWSDPFAEHPHRQIPHEPREILFIILLRKSHSPLPNLTLCLWGVARYARNPRVLGRLVQSPPARPIHLPASTSRTRPNPLSRGSSHQIDLLPALQPTRGAHSHDHPRMLRTMVHLSRTLCHFLFVPKLLVHSRPSPR